MSAIRHFHGAALAVAVIAAATPVRAQDGCNFVTIGGASVRGATDAGLALDDGRVVRLAGIELAENARFAPDARFAPTGEVVLKRLGALETDRYGRLVAHVFVGQNGAERWLQAELVRAGQARVSARVGDKACAQALLRDEQAARAAKLGLWAEPYYVINKAEDPATVLKSRGAFALVEGKVESVRESGGTIWVNFGRRWSEDFTVTIAKRNERMFSAAGLDPKSLSGRRVRIRGWIEERGGPWVEAARPEQIEVVQERPGN